jgi:hypothetical protein
MHSFNSNSAYAMQLLHSAIGQPPQDRLLVAICGITKLFVGELIEAGVCPSSSLDLFFLMSIISRLRMEVARSERQPPSACWWPLRHHNPICEPAHREDK